MTNLVGQTLGGYAVLDQLGAGGMGAVFKAKQPVLDRVVALKVIAPQVAQDSSFIARFQQEAKSAARLNHPNIVQVYAAGEETGTHFMVTEFVEGESLQQRLNREGRMDPQEALAICVFVAEGLKHAWDEAQIIHRDIKPANIFLSNKGAVKVGDLGLAKSVALEAGSALTQSGMTMGTPHYCSPEQAQGEKGIDFRADIYSLGCTLYHMLSGKRPYEAGPDQSPMSIMVKQIHDPPPAILQVLPACPMPVVLLLNKMLAKHPTGRHASYDELITDLRRVHDLLGQPQPAASVASPPASAVATKKKSPAMVYTAAAAVAVLLAARLFVWAPWKDRSADVLPAQPRAAAEQRRQDASGTPSPAAEQKPEQKEAPKPGSESRLQAEAVSTQPAKAGTRNVGALPPKPPEKKAEAIAETAKPVVPVAPTVAMTTTPKPAEEKVTVPAPKAENAFARDVAALLPEQQVARVMARLKELNPQFDSKETHKVESGAVTELSFSTAGVTDITPLKALKWLKKLILVPPALNQKGAVSDLSALQGLPLTWLWCHNNPITDLAPLRGMPLTTLSFSGTQVSDLSPLSGMKLSVFSFSDTPISDLAPLAEMPLTVLWCNNTKVTDLSPLQAMPLQELKCDFVPARDAAILRSIRTLARINDMSAQAFWIRVGPIVSRLPSTAATTTAPALAAGPEKTMTTSTGIELVWIPPGEFMLGSTPAERDWAAIKGCAHGCSDNEGDPRPIKIASGFWMGRTEVTVGQWRQFAGATGFVTDAEKSKKENWRNPKADFSPTDNHPVVWINWNDAVAFCEWLTAAERKANRLPPGTVCRLPTEAEWEYACRGNKQKTKFWWGDDPEDGKGRLNWHGAEDGFAFVSPVNYFGARGRNRFGLADMLGNVWEWCLDEFDPAGAHAECYKGNPKVRTRRGGSFSQFMGFERCAARMSSWLWVSAEHFGFRVCCGVPEGSGQAAGASTTVPTATTRLPPPSAATQQPMAGSGKAIVIEGHDLDGGFAFADTSAPYELQGTLAVPTKQDSHLLEAQKIIVAAGVEIRGGIIDIGRRGQISVEGATGKPAVFRSVTFVQNLNGHGFKARNAVFDHCKFVKSGGWFNYSSSKWELDSCLLYKCTFPSLTGKDYGLKFSHSAFVGMNFPELEHRREKGKPFDHMEHLRTTWNKIVRCQFVDCEIPPTLVWCAEESNHLGCRFVVGEAFESQSKTTVTAFVADTVGNAPDAATVIAAVTKAGMVFNYVRQPFGTYPPAISCPLADIARDMKLMNWLASRPASPFTVLSGVKTVAGTRTGP